MAEQPAVTTAQTTVASTAASLYPVVLSANIATTTVVTPAQKVGNPSVSSPLLTNISRPQSNSITLATLNNQSIHNRPLARVAPFNGHSPVTQTVESSVNQNHIQQAKPPVVYSLTKPTPKHEPMPIVSVPKKGSLFYLENLVQAKEQHRKDSLMTLAKINNRRCSACPIYGTDLVEAVTIVNSLKHSKVGSPWKGRGYVNCLNAIPAKDNPALYWDHTSTLSNIIKTPEDRVTELTDIINRFVFVIPAVTAPSMELHISHPAPWRLNEERMNVERMNDYLAPACAFLHPIVSNMKTQFPELRLIQYDCGKLQRLAHLLWELKSNHHRVLIFTQMTRMLDILEQFLNYHGHTYLRLDGNTKVEQRQALMERFNADKRIFCFILSTRSGGIGVNLTGADTVIFYDSDWNPTMDAQAQDRCHRIGQTRDVHIYRLISERTIEENILKKANQKRILGNLAIEGGNFTTAFFKKNSIHDLFGICEQMIIEEKKVEEIPEKIPDNQVQFSQKELEQALGMAEEESDLQAAQTASAEAVAELAEFDESIPLDNDSRDNEEKSAVEEELDKLMYQLTPVERYALQFLESMQEPVSLEQLKLAEEEIEAQKKDWELGHLKALKEEEERRSRQLGDKDSPLFCSREATNQVTKSSSRSKRNKSPKNNSPASKSSTPKRRSKRIIIKKEKLDSIVDSEESNDIELKHENSLQNLLKGPTNGDFASKISRQSVKWNSHKPVLKVTQTPLIIKPFSNPNLVIRTRRASAIEAEEKSKSESESELSVPSPKTVNNAILTAHRSVTFIDALSGSTVTSSPSNS